MTACVTKSSPPLKSVEDVKCARSIQDVRRAWRLVHDVYVDAGLIEPRRSGMHTWPQTFSERTAVFFSLHAGAIQATITAIGDGPLGLPLDSVYSDVLSRLRRRGCRLMEAGLFADAAAIRCSERSGGTSEFRMRPSQLLALTGMVFHFGRTQQTTDFVVGVHPRHVPYYVRMWGFAPCAAQRSYGAVNEHPVVLLRGNWRELLAQPAVPRALAEWTRVSLPPDMHLSRIQLAPERNRQAARLLAEWNDQIAAVRRISAA